MHGSSCQTKTARVVCARPRTLFLGDPGLIRGMNTEWLQREEAIHCVWHYPVKEIKLFLAPVQRKHLIPRKWGDPSSKVAQSAITSIPFDNCAFTSLLSWRGLLYKYAVMVAASNGGARDVSRLNSLPADVRWVSVVTHSFLPHNRNPTDVCGEAKGLIPRQPGLNYWNY